MLLAVNLLVLTSRLFRQKWHNNGLSRRHRNSCAASAPFSSRSCRALAGAEGWKPVSTEPVSSSFSLSLALALSLSLSLSFSVSFHHCASPVCVAIVPGLRQKGSYLPG